VSYVTRVVYLEAKFIYVCSHIDPSVVAIDSVLPKCLFFACRRSRGVLGGWARVAFKAILFQTWSSSWRRWVTGATLLRRPWTSSPMSSTSGIIGSGSSSSGCTSLSSRSLLGLSPEGIRLPAGGFAVNCAKNAFITLGLELPS
jgi:hypothetical protein